MRPHRSIVGCLVTQLLVGLFCSIKSVNALIWTHQQNLQLLCVCIHNVQLFYFCLDWFHCFRCRRRATPWGWQHCLYTFHELLPHSKRHTESDYNEMHACMGASLHNYLGTPRNTCGWTSHIVTPKVPYNRRKYHQPL